MTNAELSVKDREREFHDQRFAHDVDPRSVLGKYYSITDESKEYYRNQIRAAVPEGGRVLEYGCGNIVGSIDFYKSLKCDLYGIDLSAEAIKKAEAAATANDFPSTYLVADAENTGLEGRSFDLVMGTGILHHLDIDKSMAELSRLIKPNGCCVFFEPLGHNPAINLFRALTPKFRSPDEHPLHASDLETMRRYFRRIDVSYFHCFNLMAVAFRRTPLFQWAARSLSQLDARLVRNHSWFRKYCWICVIRMSEPV